MKKTEVLEEIEERIIFLDYEPGEKLREDELQEEFGIGRTPLRETLIKLESKGLIRSVPRSGTHVSTVSLEELRNAYEVRNYLIRVAGEKAAKKINLSDLKRLKELIGEMQTEDDPEDMIKLDFQAHELINQATQNTILTDNLRKLRQQTFRGWAAPNFNGCMESFTGEFSEIAESLYEGDEKKTGKLLAAHLRSFLDRLSNKFITTEHGRRREEYTQES